MATADITILSRPSGDNPQIQFSGSAHSSIVLETLESGSIQFTGDSGSLFSISDSLSGSLMSVNDISGLPILEVFSDDKVVMGSYGQNTLVVTGSNIGIGTTSPTQKLDVYGDMIVRDSDGTITLGSAGTNAVKVYAGTGDELYLGSNNEYQLRFPAGGGSVYLRDTYNFRTATYTSGILGNGFKINDDTTLGTSLEIDNITVRNTLRTHVFQKDVVKATNGILYVSDSGVVSSTTGTTGAGTVSFKDAKSATFVASDELWYKDANETDGTIESVKFTIDNPLVTTVGGTGDTAYTTYNVTATVGDLSNIATGGTAVRTSGGVVIIDASSANSPYVDVVTGGTTKVRLGNLAGITDTDFQAGALSGYGLYTDNVFLKGNISVVSNTSLALINNSIMIGNITGTANSALKLTNTGTNSTSGLFGYDSAGTEVIRLRLDGNHQLAGWDIVPGVLQYDNAAGSIALDATNKRVAIYTGSINTAKPKVVMGNLPTTGTAYYGFAVFSGSANADINDDTTYSVLITKDKARLAGWDLEPGSLESDNTFGSVRLSSIEQALTIWTGSVNEAQPKLVLGKLPLHDGTVDTPYGFAVFSGTGTVSGSEASASVLITANKARLAGWELEPGQLKSGTVADINGNNASIALGTGATSATGTPTDGLFFVSASANPVFYVGSNFSYVNNTLTAAGWTIGPGEIYKGDIHMSAVKSAFYIDSGSRTVVSLHTGSFDTSLVPVELLSARNPSFEDNNLLNWTATPMTGGTFSVGTTTPDPYHGTYYATAVVATHASFEILTSTISNAVTVSVLDGDTITGKLAGRADAQYGGQTFQYILKVQGYNGTWNDIASNAVSLASSTWQYIEVSEIASTTYTQIRLHGTIISKTQPWKGLNGTHEHSFDSGSLSHYNGGNIVELAEDGLLIFNGYSDIIQIQKGINNIAFNSATITSLNSTLINTSQVKSNSWTSDNSMNIIVPADSTQSYNFDLLGDAPDISSTVGIDGGTITFRGAPGGEGATESVGSGNTNLNIGGIGATLTLSAGDGGVGGTETLGIGAIGGLGGDVIISAGSGGPGGFGGVAAGADGSEGEISLDVGGANKITITSTGVGIGITNPTLPLYINGNTHIKGTVGIGTLTPSNKLHVYTSDTSTTPMFEIEQASTGDAGLMFTIPGDSYTVGIDNTSDAFQIAYSSTTGGAVLGTSVFFVVEPTGNVGIGTTNADNNLHVYRNTANTFPVVKIENANANGDVGLHFEAATTQDFVIGIDATDDSFRISDGTTLGAGDALVINSAGNITKPNNATFSAFNTVDDTFVINTATTVDFDTEIFDIGSNFASDVFTAPVTGKYSFSVSVRINLIDTAAANYQVRLVTSNRTYYEILDPGHYTSDVDYLSISFSVIADMDASDTAYVAVYQNGGTTQSSIEGQSNSYTRFSGYLLG